MSDNTWDANKYAEHARFVSDLGAPVLELLSPRAGESILDLGCGDGALTKKLSESGAEVLGIDASESMVAAARKLGVMAEVGDMHALALGRRFSAVFTNAVLHWTRDINAVLRGVALHLEPGGRFVGEFGGFGNVAAVATALRAALEMEQLPPPSFVWYYPTPEEFGERLSAAGFAVESLQLIPRPTPVPTGIQGWLEMFRGPFTKDLEDGRKQRLFDRVEELLRPSLCDSRGQWTVDYVRLRFSARHR